MSTIPADSHNRTGQPDDAAEQICTVVSPEEFLVGVRSVIEDAHQTIREIAASVSADSFAAYAEAASYLIAARDSLTDAIGAMPAGGRRGDD